MAEMDMGLAPRGNKNKKKKKRKKQSFWDSIVSGLIPCKGDSTNEIVRKIVFLVALVVLVVAVVLIGAHYLQYGLLNARTGGNGGEFDATDKFIVDLKNKTPTPEQIQQLPQGTINSEYASLYAENNDFIGWLSVPGTNINYPVMQTENNDDYLHTNFQKEYAFEGTLFADYRGKITAEEMPQNTVIYGHNMLYKFQFSSLTNYLRDIDFVRLAPVVDFNTLYQNNKYKIISVFLTNIFEEDGEVFDYTGATYFKNQAEFFDFVLECEDRSIYDTGVDVEYGDEFLTMSTCNEDTYMDLRLVVVARKVRPNEAPEVDTERIVRKSSIKYFDGYYAEYGQLWKGRTWDISLVKGMEEYIRENGLEDDPEDYEE